MNGRDNNRPRSERWERENAAPRLKEVAPRLLTLKIQLSETRGEHPVGNSRRVQHVMVETASARFEIPCGDAECQDGGHDLSRIALRHLGEGQASFGGTSECRGALKNRPCDRSLTFTFEATYGPRKAP